MTPEQKTRALAAIPELKRFLDPITEDDATHVQKQVATIQEALTSDDPQEPVTTSVEMQRYENAVAEENLAWQVYVAAIQSRRPYETRANLGALARIASNQRCEAAHQLALSAWKDQT